MKNYIKINNKKIELTAEQVKELKESLCSDKVRLKEIPAGETVKIGDYVFIVLQQYDETTKLILKDILKKNRFGENNNYRKSEVDKICEAFADSISDIIGEENIIPHTLDLTSDDGLEDYGLITRRASLITADMYRRFVYILDKYKLDSWWWLATALTTKTHDDETWVKCVAPSGGISNFDCCFNFIGVRPFCVLRSDIFVSR